MNDPEAYWEPCQTSFIELFAEKLAVNYVCKR